MENKLKNQSELRKLDMISFRMMIRIKISIKLWKLY